MRRPGIALVAVALSTASPSAQTGFYLPTTAPSYGQDEFRAADGTTCRSTMDGTRRIEVGTFASGSRIDSANPYGLPGYVTSPNNGNAGVYGRFAMSLDAAPKRMNCNRLYELEIEKRELEVEMMKRSLRAADQRLDELSAARPKTKLAKTGRGLPPP